MTKKEFLLEVKELEGLSDEAMEYLEKELKKPEQSKQKVDITESGKIILAGLSGIETDDFLLAKEIAEELEMSPRGVSGAMRKLVNDGYVESNDESPKGYKITEKGIAKVNEGLN